MGMKTVGITESTLTQTNKVKADDTLKLFLAWVDGQLRFHAWGTSSVVTSVGANTLWGGSQSTIQRSRQSDDRSIHDGLRALLDGAGRD